MALCFATSGDFPYYKAFHNGCQVKPPVSSKFQKRSPVWNPRETTAVALQNCNLREVAIVQRELPLARRKNRCLQKSVCGGSSASSKSRKIDGALPPACRYVKGGGIFPRQCYAAVSQRRPFVFLRLTRQNTRTGSQRPRTTAPGDDNSSGCWHKNRNSCWSKSEEKAVPR